MAEPDFGRLFREAKVSALHLEMRDGYMTSDPGFAAWQRGERIDPVQDPDMRPWVALMKETTGRGVAVRRARIVSEPVTDYIRYEHYFTPGNIAGGEQVRWLPRRRASDLALPGNDFWLFDNRLVQFLHFAGDGEFAQKHDEFTTEAEVVKLCATAFESVWERAVPHAEYEIV
ncbi:DUF6879 family protein [Streptomyces sp. 8L]|uniref:DUF6879 family protein n=1 Tax=Streptomyces sp. 8L TaxID=2877242 RepID=UPI001CD4AA29|nr:DUF6879 family protein [Streptomyces sp. 8L]MCA1217811.1 hypothetical protein [Streptomyces sp. 8L]